VLEPPPYSPDQAPNYFSLFPNIREILNGIYSNNTYNIRNNMTEALKVIPQSHFQNCFEDGLGAGIGA
jgi:hypothetical protein